MLLSASPFMGPLASFPAPAPPFAQETWNLQLLPSDGAALGSLLPVIGADGGTVQPTTITGLYTVTVPSASAAALADALDASPAVASAAPAQTVQIQTAPDDPDYTNNDEWQLDGTWGIDAPGAWSLTTGSDSVIVADVDSGLNYNLPDMVDNVWLNQAEIPASVMPNLTDVEGDGIISFADLNAVVNGVAVNQGPGKIEDSDGDAMIDGTDVLDPLQSGGWTDGSTQDGDTAHPDDLIGWDFVTNTNNPMDDEGHGTFTASEIAEVGNDGVQGTGVDWTAQLMPLEFIDSSGNGTDTAAAEAINYAVDHGAKVINASWGGAGTDPVVQAALQYADQHGVIVVAASGNNSTDDDSDFFFPASYSADDPNVISVAATTNTGALASFSNYGVGTVQLAAPGNGVYGLDSQGNFTTMSGTSMAAPLVTGTIALVEAAHPSWTMTQVIDAVLDTVTPDPALEGKVSTGGILNAAAAVANTSGPYVTSATPDGSIAGGSGFAEVNVTFNEEINPATFTAAAVTLVGPDGSIKGITVAAVAGSNDHTFAISFPTQSASSTYALTVGPDVQDWYGNDMDQNRNGINGQASDAFVDTIRQSLPGGSDVLAVTGIPSTITAGTAATFTVTAVLPGGDTDSGFVGTIDFTSSDGQAVLPASYTLTSADAGTYSFAVTFKTSGVQSITATDATAPSIAGTEDNIFVAPAAAATLQVTGFPTPDTAGDAGIVAITAYDAYGNVATGYTGMVDFTSTDPHASLPAATTMTPEDRGTMDVPVRLDTAGVQSITATDNATATITGVEAGIAVLPAAVHALTVTAATNTPGAGVTTTVSVAAVDAYGNAVPGFLGTVTLSSTDPRATFLPSSYTFTSDDDGKHTFTVSLDSAGLRSITASDAADGLSGSATITVQPGAAAVLAISPAPATVTAGSTFDLTVTAYDAYGNAATGFAGTVLLTSTDPQAASLDSYAFTAADLGTHTFPVTLMTTGQRIVSADDPTVAGLSATTPSIDVEAAALSGFLVSGFPASITAGIRAAVSATAVDSFGNPVTSFTGTVTLTSNDPLASFAPASYTFTSADEGKHTFAATLYSAGSQIITANDTADGAVGIESGIVVAPGDAATLQFSGFPDSVTAGAAQQVTVTAYDAYGNVATGYSGTVVLSSSDAQAVLPAAYTFTDNDDGTHVFTVTLDTAGVQSISAEDDDDHLSASETGITVTAGSAVALDLAGFPDSVTAGTAHEVAVTAYDAYGNVATGFTGTVALGSSDAQAVLPATYTFTDDDDGTHVFTVTLDTAGVQSISAEDDDDHLSASETGITVTAGSAVALDLAGFPDSITAGTAHEVTVTAYDAYGNVATGFTGTVALGSSDAQAVLPATYTFTDDDVGTHVFTVTLDTAGVQLISTDDDADHLAASESGIVVAAGSASSLGVSGFPTTEVAGASHTVTVTAYDAHGNVATGFTGTVLIGSSDSQAVLPAKYTFTAADGGEHDFSVALATAGSQSITASDTANAAVAGVESGIAVGPAAAVAILFGQQPTNAPAGAAIGPAVTVDLEDAYHNLVADNASTVILTLHGGMFAGGLTTAAAVAAGGVASFAGLEIDAAGDYTLTATDGSLIPAGVSTGFVISPAAPARLVILTQPSPAAMAGQALAVQPVIAVEDQYGNLETRDDETVVTALAAEGALGGTVTAQAEGGIAAFSNLAEDAAGTVAITFASGTLPATTGDPIAIAPATGNRLVVTSQPPSSLQPGQTFTLVVAAEDPFGNVDTTFDGNVTLSIAGDPLFTTTVQAWHGTATFVGLALDGTTGAESIQASAAGLAAAVASPVTVASPSSTSSSPTSSAPPTPSPSSTSDPELAPTIVAAQLVTTHRTNRNGKPVGKAVLAGFAIEFSTAMDPATAGLASDYQLAATIAGRIHRKVVTLVHPVPFDAAYDAATQTVILTVQENQKFADGGRITINASAPGGVADAAGVLLASADTVLTIAPRAAGVTLG